MPGIEEMNRPSSVRLKQYWDRLWNPEGDTVTQHTVRERIEDRHIGIKGSKLFDEVVSHLSQKPDPVVLEAGCGQAIWVIELRQRGYQIHGLDYSLSGLEVASRYQSGLSLINADILRLPFKAHSFDVVLSWGVVEHFEDLSWLALSFAEKRRVLKTGGELFITVPVENQFLLAKEELRALPGIRRLTRTAPFFEHRFRVEVFLDLLRTAGFKIDSWRYHATEFGLAVSIPRLFESRDSAGRYTGLNLFGRIVHELVVRRFPVLTAHQMLVIAKKRN
jgi:SAM-dependent methyltransferase